MGPISNSAAQHLRWILEIREGSSASGPWLRVEELWAIQLAEMCARLRTREPRLLADQLFLLMEAAQVSTQILGARGPAGNVARAAESLIEAQVRAS